MAFKRTEILNKSEYEILKEFYRPIFAAHETLTHPEVPCLCPNEGWKKFQFSITNNTSSTQLVDLFKNNNETITKTYPPLTENGAYPVLGSAGEVGQPVYNPNNRTIYTASRNIGEVVVTNGDTKATITNISVGTGCDAAVLNDLDNTVYVSNVSGDSVSVIDCDSNSVIATISVGDGPRQITFNPKLNRIYVANFTDDTVSVIACSTNTVIATISVGTAPFGVVYASSVDRIYVTNTTDGDASVINPNTNTVVGSTITLGTEAGYLDYSAANESVYVSNAADGTVSVINTNTNTVSATITVGTFSAGVKYNSINQLIYVANPPDDTASVIDVSNNSVINTISVGDNPVRVGFNIDLNEMYFQNEGAAPSEEVGIIVSNVTFENVVNYDYFVTQQFTDPFKVACIRIQSLTQEQLFSAFLVQFKDASGEVYTYPRFPFEKINTYQEQDTITHLKFDQLVLDTTQSFVNYELLANETVTFILCYKPLIRSDFLKDNKDHYTKQLLDIEDRQKCYISWKQKHIDLQNKFYKGDLQNKSHYSFTIQNPSGSDVAIDLFDSVTQEGFAQRYPTLTVDDETSYDFFTRSMRWSPYRVPLMEVISSDFEQTKQAVVVNLRYAGGDIYNRAYYPNLEIDPYQTITNRVTIPFADLVFHTEIKFTSYIVLAGQTVSFVVFYERLKRADFFAKHYKTKINISYGVKNRTMGKCA